MDPWPLGDSDPRWRLQLTDNLNNSVVNLDYEITENCPELKTINQIFGSRTYDCTVPNYTGRWRGSEDDGPIVSPDADTGWKDIVINGSNLTVRNGTWTTYQTYEATANGDRCNSVGSNNRVTWRITLDYKISGTPYTPQITFNQTAISACHGNRVNLTASVVATGAWTARLSDGQQVSGNGNQNFSVMVQPAQTTTYSVQSFTNGNSCSFSSNTVTIAVPNRSGQLANDNENATCIVNANETVHFYHPQSGNYIATVSANGTGLGSTRATAFIDGSPLHVTACENVDPQYANHVLQRHWVITPTTNGSATVFLPYRTLELQMLMNYANTNANPSDDVVGVESLRLSKYSGGPNAVNVNRNPFDNCAQPNGTGVGGTTVHTASQSGNINYLPNLSMHHYSSFSVPGFSEFWLHGNSTLIPLNNDLEEVALDCRRGNVEFQVKWKETNVTKKAVVEYSNDGVNWMYERSLENENSTFEPVNAKYYRVKLLNASDEMTLYREVVNECKYPGVLLYPNPLTERLYFELGNFAVNGKVTMKFMDLSGRNLFQYATQQSEGYIDLRQEIPVGIYFVHIENDMGQIDIQKVEMR